ncbi:MAG: DUF2202 domain-containing protein [Anaerolineales bacterium]|nr:DUF2202 domain-containing protein [Anaerolineales bacterium]
MLKKILLVAALVIVIGALVVGAVNRTQAKSTTELSGQTGHVENEVLPGLAQQIEPEEIQAHEEGGYGRGAGELDLVQPSTAEGAGRQGGGGQGRGAQTNGRQGEGAGQTLAASGDLSAAETEALLFMREEEKLAHDVYLTLYEQWGLAIFQNIASSEQEHTDTVKSLLERYGLQDPASTQVGVFSNPELQSLYDKLVAQGSQSLAEALKVGAAIEEIDILDLEERLAVTDNADLQQVFNNLLNGSYNHLRSFVSTLQSQTGETYQPQYLSPEAYQAILAGTTGAGGRGAGGGQGGQGGQGYRGGNK